MKLDQPADRVEDVGRTAAARDSLSGAGHDACYQPRACPQAGFDVAGGVADDGQLTDRAATEPKQGGQRQIRPPACRGQRCR